MAWKEWPVSEQRLVLVHRVVHGDHAVAGVAREMGVSRKTAYKWIDRYRADPLAMLCDRSRRPVRSPHRCDAHIEQAVLAVHDEHRWGARKIHRLLCDRGLVMPSTRTTAAILKRHGRVGRPAPPQQPTTQRFERPAPNDLWQLDHKGVIEIDRRRCYPLAVIDDHSRYCLCLKPAFDVTVASAWSILWELMGEVGMPSGLLCDNAFSASIGLSWFDEKLVRLGIRPVHGRPRHPQTQGKIERFNGSVQRELIDFNARRDSVAHFEEDARVWRRTYNTLRPHKALDDQPPISRWQPSHRVRPDSVPPATYPPGATLRKVTQVGDVYYRQTRILVGRALARQQVRIVEREHDIAILYAEHLVRVINHDQLGGGKTYKLM